MSIKDQLLHGDQNLTPAEEKIVRTLIADYPTAGLTTAKNLARRAGVSDPTVVRLAVKLGFSGFPDFQSKLLAEVEARLHSPLLMMEAKRPEITEAEARQGPAVGYLHSVAAAVDKAATTTPSAAYERAARLIMEAKGKVMLLGGRFSRYLAGILAGYLTQFRPGVCDLEALSAQAFDSLADLSKRDLLVVFDYRRYQIDVMAYARQAAARGVRIALFTDVFLSPVSELAEIVFVSPLEVASPYDTLAPALAQLEALVTHLLAMTGEQARERIEDIERVRQCNEVTLDRADATAVDLVDDGAGAKVAACGEK